MALENCKAAITAAIGRDLTKEEEAFPEIGGDGALYYSSKGLPGMGGFDLFKASGEKANWTVPVNLKWPQSTKNLTPEGAPKAAETLNSKFIKSGAELEPARRRCRDARRG